MFVSVLEVNIDIKRVILPFSFVVSSPIVVFDLVKDAERSFVLITPRTWSVVSVNSRTKEAASGV